MAISLNISVKNPGPEDQILEFNTMVPAYYAVLEDIGYLIRHERRKRAGETLRERDVAFQYEGLR